MKFSELKSNFEEKEGYVPKIRIKNYVPLINKIDLIDDLKDNVIEEVDESIFTINHIKKIILVDGFLIKNCTNIELDEEDLISQYDYLESKGIINKIHESIDKASFDKLIDQCLEQELSVRNKEVQFELFKDFTDRKIEQEVLLSNTIESIITDTFNKIIEKMPSQETMTKISESVKDLDPSKFGIIKKLFDFAKG